MDEILIIGGGVIGLSIARSLHKAGMRRITVVERGWIGREASHAAAGMLAPHAETEKADDFYYFCRDSARMYPKFAADLLDETGINIELDQNGTVYLAFTEQDARDLDKRYRNQHAAGLPVERLSRQEILELEPNISPAVREGLFYPDDWQVENRKLLDALRKYAELNGIDIREHTSISELIIENGCVTGARNDTSSFRAEVTVLATGAGTSFIKFGGKPCPIAVKPIRGQMICFVTANRLLRKVVYTPRGYLVPRADGRILVGATVEDVGFDKATTVAGIESLRQAAAEIAPVIADLEIAESWSGLRPFAADGLPVLGELTGYNGLIIATAHYRNGILLAPLTASILTDHLTGCVRSRYLDCFSPQRFQVAAVG